MARLRRQWAAQQVAAWQSVTGKPLTWMEPKWQDDRSEAERRLQHLMDRHVTAKPGWDTHATQCRLITRVASDPETVQPRG
jgi:hypothetical protein